MPETQVVVVGAGPSGLSAALALKDLGRKALLLDKADRIASSWRARYERLRLNTCRPFSHLPDRRFPKGTPMFPSRDQLIEHLERHAGEDGLELMLGASVERIDRSDGAWAVRTSADEIEAAQVIVCTGYEKDPVIPTWEGRDRFEGRLLHSSEYMNADPFREMAVLVVGAGSSGMEIAYDLAEGGAGKLWLAVRTPPNIVLRAGAGGVPGDMLGVALLHTPTRFGDAVTRFAQRMDIGDLSAHGLRRSEEGVFRRLRKYGTAPTIVDPEVIDAVKSRRIEVVPGVESLDQTGVALSDGARLEPDAVICATGYRRGLEPLVGHLGVLDSKGVPRARGGKPAAPGLRFVGYVPRPGGLGYMAKEAKRAARAIARELSA